MNKILATDISYYADKAVNIDDMINWPVTDTEYNDILNKSLEIFESACSEINQQERNLILLDSNFLIYLSQVIHASLVSRRSREFGFKLLIGKLSQDYYLPQWDKLTSPGIENRNKAVYSKVRSLLKYFYINKPENIYNWIKSTKRNETMSVGSVSWLLSSYAKNQKAIVKPFYVEDKLPKQFLGTKEKGYLGVIDEIIARITKYCKLEYDLDLNFNKEASVAWKNKLHALAQIAEHIQRLFTSDSEVWITGPAKPLAKLVSLSCRMTGGKSVGFSHGNESGLYAIPSRACTEISSYNEFVFTSDNTAKSESENYTTHIISKSNTVNFISCKNDYYVNLIRRQSKWVSKKINSVMLIGFPMNATRYGGLKKSLFHYFLALEIKLARLLRAWGYKVLYKAHPDRLGHIDEIMSTICDDVIKSPFEKSWRNADAVLFYRTDTTTFGYALCTNKPIILLSLNHDQWTPDRSELIRRRCHVVNAWDSEHEIFFDKQELRSAFEEPGESADYSYVYKFMC